MVQLLQLKGAGIGAPRTIIFLKWLLYSLHWIYNLHLRVLGILYISVVAGFPFHISCVFTVCELCVFLLHTITCVFTMCMSLCVSSSDLMCSTHCVFLLQLHVVQVVCVSSSVVCSSSACHGVGRPPLPDPPCHFFPPPDLNCFQSEQYLQQFSLDPMYP